MTASLKPTSTGGYTAAEIAAARIELAAIRQARDGVETFGQFVKRTAPQYWPVPPHLRVLYNLFQASRTRRIFATVSMPPRHGKTTTFRLGLSWRMLYDPACLNFYTTFGADLAEETGHETRKIILETLALKLSKAKKMDFGFAAGGGLKSTSVGGSITGRGCNGGIIINDDTVKGMEAANSKGERDRIWQWLRSDVLSRLEGGSSSIVCNTRWHEDDPIGRLQEDPLGYDWIHINLPAIHDGEFNPIDERDQPDRAVPLWEGIDANNPTREGAMAWYAQKRAAGEYEWWSLYQGVPRSKERRIFAMDPTRYELIDWRWTGKRGIVSLDPAATERTAADHTACAALAIDGIGDTSHLYVRKVSRAQMTVPNAARLAMVYQTVFKLPVAVESVGGFKAVPQMLRELAPKLRIEEIVPLGDKLTRAMPLSKLWQNGRVSVPIGEGDDHQLDAMLIAAWNKLVRHEALGKGAGWEVPPWPRDILMGMDWIDPYLAEMRKFSGLGDKEDDQVDATAHGFNRLYFGKVVDKTGYYEAVH